MIKNLPLFGAEPNLVTECIKNNRLAQKEMYERLSSRMFAVCLRYIGDRETAKDVLQDGFIQLFSKLKQFKGDGSFEGWARRLFINTALMQIRKSDILKSAQDIETPKIDLPHIEGGAIELLEAKALMELISQMPIGFRTVFNMYAIEGFTHQEIAKALDITEGGSRSQLSRARIWLQERLSKR